MTQILDLISAEKRNSLIRDVFEKAIKRDFEAAFENVIKGRRSSFSVNLFGVTFPQEIRADDQELFEEFFDAVQRKAGDVPLHSLDIHSSSFFERTALTFRFKEKSFLLRAAQSLCHVKQVYNKQIYNKPGSPKPSFA